MKPSDDEALEIVLKGPIVPELLRPDAEVIEGDGWRRTVTPSSPWAADNEILFSNLGPDDVDARIDAEIDRYHALGRPMRWCVYPWDAPADLDRRLLARGASEAHVRGFVCPSDSPLRVVDDVEVRPITSPSSPDFAAYVEMMSAVWGLPADELRFRVGRFAELLAVDAPTLHLFLGLYRGEPAGGGAFVLKGDHAYFTGDFVAPRFQARGVLQSTLAARLAALAALGVPYGVGHARESGTARWLQRLGWRTVINYRIYQLEPPRAGG